MSWRVLRSRWACVVAGLLLHALAALPARAAEPYAFELALFKDRFEHEVAFRAAAIHVAWGAEPLCDSTTEIEPFLLWSVHALRKSLSAKELELLRRATGMDEHWRVAWMDESVPDALDLGAVVVAVNGRPLPGAGTRFDAGALFKGGSFVSSDDQGFWDVMLKAREQANDGQLMNLTLSDGRRLDVPTQTGCAGSVTASAFDADPSQFWRQGNQRVRIPANAMLEARSRDEFRWLAAFGTYFQASEAAIGRAQQAEGLGTAFVIGKILTLAVPGAGLLLTAAEAHAEQTLVVDSIVGRADLFANEVVTALGGDAAAGLKLNQRFLAKGLKVDAVLMSEFRRSNAAEHARRLYALQAAKDKAQAEAEAAEQRAHEAARAQRSAP